MKNEFILNIIATDDGTHIGGRSNGKTINMASDANVRRVAKVLHDLSEAVIRQLDKQTTKGN